MKSRTLELVIAIGFTAVASVLVGGCAGVSSYHREMIDTLVIRNETASPILDVVLRVPKSNMIVTTNKILPFREYSLGFTASKNARDRATLSWTHRDRAYTHEVETYIPDDIEGNVPARVVIRVGDHGQLSSRIEPHASRG